MITVKSFREEGCENNVRGKFKGFNIPVLLSKSVLCLPVVISYSSRDRTHHVFHERAQISPCPNPASFEQQIHRNVALSPLYHITGRWNASSSVPREALTLSRVFSRFSTACVMVCRACFSGLVVGRPSSVQL